VAAVMTVRVSPASSGPALDPDPYQHVRTGAVLVQGRGTDLPPSFSLFQQRKDLLGAGDDFFLHVPGNRLAFVLVDPHGRGRCGTLQQISDCNANMKRQALVSCAWYRDATKLLRAACFL